MKMLFDTNVIIDILLKRDTFFENSYGALKRALEQYSECYISATAATDIYYLLRKGLKDTAAAHGAMERLLQLVAIKDVLALDIQAALGAGVPDFEDAVVVMVAVRNKVDVILTRNVKDFEGASVTVLAPDEFLL